jgi:hypothetical protein
MIELLRAGYIIKVIECVNVACLPDTPLSYTIQTIEMLVNQAIASMFCLLSSALLLMITLRIICHLAAVVMVWSGPLRH